MLVLPVMEPSQVGEARRQLVRLATRNGLRETDVGRVALVATELATNLVKHATSGGVLLGQALAAPPGDPAIEILALDRGPGIDDLARSLRDGYSTAGTLGTGLGAIARLSDLVDVHSVAGRGTAVLARIGRTVDVAGMTHGAISVAMPGEEVSGDAWACSGQGGAFTLLVADGLGHGVAAADAANAAARAFREDPSRPPAQMIERIHEALHGTRGAAVAMATILSGEGRLLFAGVGNVAGTIVANGSRQGLVSHNGTAGLTIRKVQEFSYDWPAEGLLVMHSDGLASRWDLGRYPGLTGRHPALIAGVLYRDYARGRDDVTVAVVRSAAVTDGAAGRVPEA